MPDFFWEKIHIFTAHFYYTLYKYELYLSIVFNPKLLKFRSHNISAILKVIKMRCILYFLVREIFQTGTRDSKFLTRALTYTRSKP